MLSAYCQIKTFSQIKKTIKEWCVIFCKINSGAISGICAYPVSVEADIGNGLPNFSMVGLLSSEVKESRERVRSAIRNSGFVVPPKRITINLSPADIRKEGSYFDLPIAVGILVSLGIVPRENVQDTMFAGELSLDGTLKGVNGILSITLLAKELGIPRIIVPQGNAKEGAAVRGVDVIGAGSLKETVAMLNNPEMAYPEAFDCVTSLDPLKNEYGLEFADICGQETAKRAVEIAVAGMHNILMIGPPGSGKSMIANCMPTIFPEMTYEEIIEITRIYSTMGLMEKQNMIRNHPFRAPHHTITAQALVGGGRIPKPGEVTLAHKGMLFLDELPEYSRSALETLRQPLEDQKVNIARDKASHEFPADFMLAAAMNPCPCGYYPDKARCSCTQYNINKYSEKIRGPLLDRIDICIYMNPVKINLLQKDGRTASSAEMKSRIEKAREMQRMRYEDTGICFNSRLKASYIKEYCPVPENCQKLLSDSYERLGLSARAYHKIVKVARTIADLDGETEIRREHILEAIAYRNTIKEKGL
ncbi:YifB family Mg chelatase-like AAA ATPase [Parasporobacterium paucivorans]|uniref:Magnesium chelatase family protein n=1 Tax=Parasporobacterium paucivorans DSM 15970 TaxID=1122934 RepID=A0A1M6G9G0_9FIRM|nr:YifB family Mg chelatase-like AAA ATPase [Parasporobacterium paucivorans]SHJ06549.1 magnesium chelatase family protein [Parasporobacterium paucivorans DSM 15970]